MIEGWLLPSLATLPVFIGSYLIAGIPWALVVLPRRDWRDRTLVVTLGLALGAMLWTTGMFLIGTFLTITLAGTLLMGALVALTGIVLARRRARLTVPVDAALREPLAFWEWAILTGLVVAAVLRVIHTAYWPFAAYDPLWVYGYNARVFTLTAQIPTDMGYYPQFIPLSYTFGQLVWGSVNDHAARMIVPVIGMGSILAAYLLGARMKGRRLGLMLAAFWAFYPHHAQWSRFGDLEVPVTFFFTLAALFFMTAWRDDTSTRWRYAVAAGLMLGGGMWTKPTAGALVWGFGLVFLMEAVRTRLDLSRLMPKFWLVFVVGLASAPIGGMWYIRNILLGHPAVVFPPAYWLTQAHRSGQEFGWPLLIAALLAIYLTFDLAARRRPGRIWMLLGGGAVVMIAGALPSAGLWHDTPTHRITAAEAGVMLAGLLLYAAGLWRWWLVRRDHESWLDVLRHPAALAVALALPYWFTWFYSYSYHPRLAFAITPLQLFLVALLVAAIMPHLAAYVRPTRQAAILTVLALVMVVPGTWLYIEETLPRLIAQDLPDDDAKQLASNPATFRVVQKLREEAASGPIHVLAPGALRLPFFFPEMELNTDPVTDLSALDGTVTHYVQGLESENMYRSMGRDNQVRWLPWRRDLAENILSTFDADFNYEVFRVDTAKRFEEPWYNGVPPEPIVYEDFAELLGYTISGLDFWPGRRIVFSTMWRVLDDIEEDYTIYVHILDGDGNLYATWDHIPGEHYNTYLWEAGEFVVDETSVYLYEDVPPGSYRVVAGLYDFSTGERVPVRVGDEVTDSFVLIDEIRMVEAPPE